MEQTCGKYKVTETKQSHHKHGVHIISMNMWNINKQNKNKNKNKKGEVGWPQKIECLTKLFEAWCDCVRNRLSVGNGEHHSLLGFDWLR